MNEARNDGDSCAELVPALLRWAGDKPPHIKSLAGIVGRSLHQLAQEPERPGLRTLTMQNIERLRAALS